MTEDVVRGVRHALGIRPVYKTVDTCAAEFAARTPYHYSLLRRGDRGRAARAAGGDHPRLRAQPDRPGHRVRLLLRARHPGAAARPGYETVMVNCNPETVSTDYDTSDRLYFEPLTLEDVLEVVHAEQQAGPIAGVICQLGGQTPLGLAQGLEDAGVPIVGTSPGGDPPRRGARRVRPGARRGRAARAQARHGDVVRRGPRRSPPRSATRCWCGRRTCSAGAAWRSSTTTRRSRGYIAARHRDQPRAPGARRPVHRRRGRDRRRRALRRRGALPRRRDGAHRGGRHPLRRLVVRAAADHPRRGGDPAGSARPPRRSPAASGVRGLLNIQFALGSDVLYVLEANPRASRTVPFVSKATATPLAKAAARVMLGETIAALRAEGCCPPTGDGGDLPADAPIAVKEAVMPFNRFRTLDGRTVDTVLGPEMRSTGEVMGFDADFGTRVRQVAGRRRTARCPPSGRVFVSMANRDKRHDDLPGQAAGRPRLRDPRDPGHRRGAAPQRRPGDRRAQAHRGSGAGRRADHRRS